MDWRAKGALALAAALGAGAAGAGEVDDAMGGQHWGMAATAALSATYECALKVGADDQKAMLDLAAAGTAYPDLTALPADGASLRKLALSDPPAAEQERAKRDAQAAAEMVSRNKGASKRDASYCRGMEQRVRAFMQRARSSGAMARAKALMDASREAARPE